MYGFHLVVLGRRKEGIEHAKRAVELDPLSLSCRVRLVLAYYLDRQYDQALGQVRELLQFDDNPEAPRLSVRGSTGRKGCTRKPWPRAESA